MDTVNNSKERVNIKVTPEIRRKLRLIGAYTEEGIMSVVDRLATQELKMLEKKRGDTHK